MTFTKFVEIGRVARINFGPLEGKLAVIVDIISENRVLVDGQNIKRQVIPTRRLRLTGHVLKIGRGARTGSVRQTIEKEGLQAKWESSALGKKIQAQQRRANLNDFERFRATILRKRLSKLLRIRPKTGAATQQKKATKAAKK